jgi:hypothetical protein
MWGLFEKKEKKERKEDEFLGAEHAVVPMNFESTIEEVKKLSPKAQATFLYKLVGALPQGVARTLHKYTSNRLSNGTYPNIRQKERNLDRSVTQGGGLDS